MKPAKLAQSFSKQDKMHTKAIVVLTILSNNSPPLTNSRMIYIFVRLAKTCSIQVTR